MVCSDPPSGYARWTVRLVAEEAVKRSLIPRIGRETIRVLVQHHDLKPWREKMWCVPELNDDYIASMEDTLQTYERSYDSAQPAVFGQEARDAARGRAAPAQPGRAARTDSEYARRGVANIFCAVEPKAGRTLRLPRRTARGISSRKCSSN